MKTAFALLIAALTSSPLLALQGLNDKAENPFDGIEEDLREVRWTFESDQPRMTENEAHALAGQLAQMSGTSLTVDEGRSGKDELVFVNAVDRSAILMVNLRSGGLLFNAGMDGMRGEDETPGLPDKKTARQAARSHLRTLGLLSDRKAGLRVQHVGGLRMAVHRDDGSNGEYRKLVSVWFDRSVGDFKVQGPGSRVVMQLGAQAQLRGLVWECESVKSHRLQPGTTIPLLELRRQAMLRIASVAPEAIDKTIRSAEVVYFDDGYGFMEPAVYIEAQLTLRTRDSNSGEDVILRNPYDFYVPLLWSPRAYYPFEADQGTPPPDDD